MEEMLRGVLGFKGERGYSAYEIAVKNGFIGSENDWLATLGKSSSFNIDKTLYISEEGQSIFNLPTSFKDNSNSFIDIYVDGLRLTLNEYTIDSTNKEIILTNSLIKGAEVEIVVLTIYTNRLPIVTEINESSTYDTASSSRGVYIALKEQINLIYPVGIVIINTSNENPAEYLKNTVWENILIEEKDEEELYYWKRVV